MQASDPLRFQSLTQTLDFHYQALANGVAQHAELRRVEIEKEKMEKASVTAASWFWWAGLLMAKLNLLYFSYPFHSTMIWEEIKLLSLKDLKGLLVSLICESWWVIKSKYAQWFQRGRRWLATGSASLSSAVWFWWVSVKWAILCQKMPLCCMSLFFSGVL